MVVAQPDLYEVSAFTPPAKDYGLIKKKRPPNLAAFH
jgi:hypothetical protein